MAEYLFPDERERETVLDYLAFLVQHPDKKPGFCLLHRGSHRIGKDLFYKALFLGLGQRIAREVGIQNVIGGWGDYLQGLRLAVITELDATGDRKAANALKTVLAPTGGGKLVLNLKGGKVITQVDVLGVIIMTNYHHAVSIEPGNRRFFVASSWIQPNTPEFYRGVDDWYLTQNGAAVVLGYLMGRDISGFDHRVLPYETSGFLDMVAEGKPDYTKTLSAMIDEKEPPFHRPLVTVRELQKLIKTELKCGYTGAEDGLRELGWCKYSQSVVKIEGKAVRTPAFFAPKISDSPSNREIFDYFERHKNQAI